MTENWFVMIIKMWKLNTEFYLEDDSMRRSLQKLLVKKELSQGTMGVQHLSKSRQLASQIPLAFVLLIQEFTSEVVHQL